MPRFPAIARPNRFTRVRLIGLGSDWRREALRTNLWLVPTIEVVAAIALFAGTDAIDRAAYNGDLTLPAWVISGTADAARQILTTLAAAVITVVGVVFSIMIVTLTLASTQFGPRMLRNFIRDRATQFTLGTFVATFVYAILALVSISPGAHGDFVPHLSITVSLALLVVDLAVLIYFIHHIATSIQLPQVIASIARDLSSAIDAGTGRDARRRPQLEAGPSVAELLQRMKESPGIVPTARAWLPPVRPPRHARPDRHAHRLRDPPAGASGPFPRQRPPPCDRLAARGGRVGGARSRTGHTSPARHARSPRTSRSPSTSSSRSRSARCRRPSTTPSRPLTCIDWLGDSLCQVAARWRPAHVHRDHHGYVRVITAPVSYRRLVERAFEKIRQAGRGMPAVMIRQLDSLAKIMAHTQTAEQREVLLEQAAMIQSSSDESVPEPSDRDDIRRRYDAVLDAERMQSAGAG